MLIQKDYTYKFTIPIQYYGRIFCSGYSQLYASNMHQILAIQLSDNSWQYSKDSPVYRMASLTCDDCIKLVFHSHEPVEGGVVFQGRYERDLNVPDEDVLASNICYFTSELVNPDTWEIRKIW